MDEANAQRSTVGGGGVSMLHVKDLFEKASIAMCGPIPWLTPVAESASGIYVIALVEPLAVSIETLPEPERSRWISGQEIIYIGRATSIRRRIGQFYKHEYGRRSPHRGGQAIKLLVDPMQVYWGTALDCAIAEHSMIEAFRSEVGALPFANRVRAAQKRQASN
jgi:hypothetical protein